MVEYGENKTQCIKIYKFASKGIVKTFLYTTINFIQVQIGLLSVSTMQSVRHRLRLHIHK